MQTGWVEGGDNLVGNTTLFDYEGKALPVLDAIREDYIPATITVNGTTYNVYRQGEDPSGITDVRDNNTNNNEYYTLSGVRVQHPTQGLYIHNGKTILIK